MANDENLKPPWKPGESGNPKGRPKGSKNLATIVRDLEDENFNWDLVPIKQKDKAKAIGAPWKAIVFTALAKAYSGDVKAMEWLRKSGYGDKLSIDGDIRQVVEPKIRSDIKARDVRPQEEAKADN